MGEPEEAAAGAAGASGGGAAGGAGAAASGGGGGAAATPAPAAAAPAGDMEAKVVKLMELGFDRAKCLEALTASEGNEEYAASLLFSGL